MKKLIYFTIMCIFLISLVSATIGNLDIKQANTTITLLQTSSSASYQNISSILLGNGTLIFLDASMTKNGINFYYDLAPQYTSSLGTYIVNGYGDDSDDPTWAYQFEVSNNGQNFTTGKAISYIGFIIILLFSFILTTWGTFKVRWEHLKSDEGKILTINHFRYVKVTLWVLAYLEVMFLFGLSYKFFNEANIQGFTQFFNFIYSVMLNLMYPLMIFLIIVIFVIWINNKKLQNKIKLGIS